MRRVIFNQKGGVGKSTISCNLAAINGTFGKKTLLIDLDPQGNSTQYLLGKEAYDFGATLADYFQNMLYSFFNEGDVENFIHPTPFDNLFIMPSHPDMYELESKLESRYKMFKLKETLNSLDGYTDVYIDTPPAINFFTRSALIAADTCLIPFDCDDFSRNALYRLLVNVNEIQSDHNSNLTVEGIIVNMFVSRAKFPQKIVAELYEEGLPVIDTYLSSSIKVKESHDKAQPMIFFDPKHKVTNEFLALHQKLG